MDTEDREVFKYPMHYLIQNINSTETEKALCKQVDWGVL